MNKFGCGAIGQLPPGDRGGFFSKMAASELPKDKKCYIKFAAEGFTEYFIESFGSALAVISCPAMFTLDDYILTWGQYKISEHIDDKKRQEIK